ATGSHLDPASYITDPFLTVTNVSAGPAPNTFWLNTTETLAEGTAYTVIALGGATPITSGGNTLANDTQYFTHGYGYEARPIHIGHNKEGSGALAQSLVRTYYARSLFSTAEGRPSIEGNVFFEDPLPDSGANERFTSCIFGLLNITAAGAYKFAMSSDDNGRLYLSTDEDPAHKAEIAREPSWSGSREYVTSSNGGSGRGNPPSNQSASINLAVGRYYLECVFTEGGGGNNASATWMPPGGPVFTNGEDPIHD